MYVGQLQPKVLSNAQFTVTNPLDCTLSQVNGHWKEWKFKQVPEKEVARISYW